MVLVLIKLSASLNLLDTFSAQMCGLGKVVFIALGQIELSEINSKENRIVPVN